MTTPNLNDIRLASPCKADWSKMWGDDRVRFCEQCRLNVYNLSAMSRDEAQRFVEESEGRVCVRFYQRADGKVITSDCPVGFRAVQRRLAFVATWVLGILSLFVPRASEMLKAALIPDREINPCPLPNISSFPSTSTWPAGGQRMGALRRITNPGQ